MNSLDHLFQRVKSVVSNAMAENRGRPQKRSQGGQPLNDQAAAQTVLMLLLATLKGWSWGILHRQLTAYRHPRWRRLLDTRLSEIPAYNTLTWRAHHTRVKAWQKRIYRRLLGPLLNCRNLGLLAIDLSDLPSDLRDRLANLGVCGKGPFYGYKLHLIVTRDGVPLAIVATRANLTEPCVTNRLLRQLRRHLNREQLERLRYAVADAGYDTTGIYESFEVLEAALIAAVNPRRDERLKQAEAKGKLSLSHQTRRELKERDSARDRGILRYHSARGQALHDERVVVEQVIEQIKNDLWERGRGGSLVPWWLRGVRKVQEAADRALLALVAIEHTNKLRRCDLREVAPYVA